MDEFEMVVDDVFAMRGRGTLVTGRIARGVVRVGDALLLRKGDGRELAVVCDGVEMFHKILTEGREGQNVGILLRGISKADVEGGETLCAAEADAPTCGDAHGARMAEILEDHGVSGLDEKARREILGLIRQGSKIAAIKALRQHSPVDLREAKDAVDAIQREVDASQGGGADYSFEPPSSEEDPDDARAEGILREHGVEGLEPEARREILRLIREGRKIAAIKALRQHEPPSIRLKEAKEIVEAIGRALGVEWPQQPASCFIATAACGTALAEDVVRLRQFREMVLRPSWVGRGFIGLYEMLSPPVARAIAGSGWLRGLVRRLVVRPSASIARVWLRSRRSREGGIGR